MEHGKFSVSKIWHIAKMEYIKLIMDPRMILIVAALVFAYQFITVPLLQNAAMMGKPINVYEPCCPVKFQFYDSSCAGSVSCDYIRLSKN